MNSFERNDVRENLLAKVESYRNATALQLLQSLRDSVRPGFEKQLLYSIQDENADSVREDLLIAVVKRDINKALS